MALKPFWSSGFWILAAHRITWGGGLEGVVINTDAQAPSPEMLGRAWALVLLKTRHFRVENYLPSPSPHFAYEESLGLNFPLAYKALHDLTSPCPHHLS